MTEAARYIVPSTPIVCRSTSRRLEVEEDEEDEGDEMAELSYETLREIRGRLDRRESTIEEEARRYTLYDLSEALRMTRGMLQALAEGWTQEQLLARPAGASAAEQAEQSSKGGEQSEDRWSATEALTHLVVTQNWYMLHMDRLLGRRNQYEQMPRGLGDQARQDVPKEELVRRLSEATERLLGYVASIPADADLDMARASTFFGDLSLRGWVMLAAGHDLDHLAQIERVAEEPGFPRDGADC